MKVHPYLDSKTIEAHIILMPQTTLGGTPQQLILMLLKGKGFKVNSPLLKKR